VFIASLVEWLVGSSELGEGETGMTKFMDKRMTVNVKLAQRFVRSLARKAGEGWGEGNGHGEFHYQGWQLAMTVRVNYGC